MVYHRIPWKDRFNEPTPRQLREFLPEDTAAHFDHARQALSSLAGVDEKIGWYGECWCWTLEYHMEDGQQPWALVIPSPDDLQIAMPLEQDFIDTLPQRRLRRAIRDGLDLAQAPFDTRWGVWSVQHSAVLEDLSDLLSRRHKYIVASD